MLFLITKQFGAEGGTCYIGIAVSRSCGLLCEAQRKHEMFAQVSPKQNKSNLTFLVRKAGLEPARLLTCV